MYEIDEVVTKQLYFLKEAEPLEMLEKFKQVKIGKTKKEYYEYFKEKYNESFKIEDLWFLSFSTFSNLLSFNKDGKCNVSFGERLSNEKIYCIENIKDVEIRNDSYIKIKEEKLLSEKDFVFIDPPYLQSGTTNETVYNGSWDEKKEKELLDFCRWLNEKGVRFMITNTIISKGIKNEQLMNLIKELKLNVYELTCKNRANGKKNEDYQEVIITNYEEVQMSLF